MAALVRNEGSKMMGEINLKSYLITSILLLLMVCTATGRTIYVDDDGPADFNNIQAAIDDANGGDTVLVYDGTYTGYGNENIDFKGKAITLRSENGPGNCIIDCNTGPYHYSRGFYFHSGEDADSVLDGFTITNGYQSPGGGIYCEPASPTIANCWIIGNKAVIGRPYFGGGIYCHIGTPTISNCIISGNSAGYGGGISVGARITNCEISGNWALTDDGGVSGAYSMNNCTIIGNWALRDVGGVSSKASLISNCIIRDNLPEQLGNYNSVTYSNVQGGCPGVGNIDVDPCFAEPGYWDPNGTVQDPNDDFWIDGDYHLKSQAGRWEPNSQSWIKDDITSPCIDAGNPGCPLGDEPVRNGNRRNMGAYGGTAEASKSPFYWRRFADLTNDWEVDSNDLKVFVDYWLESGECIPSDLNRSQSVDFADFALLANNWLRSIHGKSVFDFGVATKGPLHIAGNIELLGVNISIESDVYIVSENSNLALEIIGNSSITGDVFITNPDATVDLQGDLFSIGGETGEAALDHVHTGVDPIAFPIPNPSYFEHYVVSDINYPSGETTFVNVRIPPNTNPSFGGGVTLTGVVFIETPNVVTFTGNVNITGIIVGDGNITDDSGTNRIDFMGTVDSSPVTDLPAEFGELRDETGTFLMAPGFSLWFGGDLATINGAIAANGIQFYGNAGGTIEGSVLNYSDTAMELSANYDLFFNRYADTEMPAGFE